MSRIRAVCVFCGSSPGNDSAYLAAAKATGAAIARRGLALVYGGAKVGLMGAVADAALTEGGEVFGVLPKGLAAKELAHTGLTRLEVVASMHERKARMAELSDGFIALPGGVGTMEEIFEVWTWGQLGFHEKPVGFIDVAGFYAPLAAFLRHMTDQAFLKADHRDMVSFAATPEALLDVFEAYRPPVVEKWMEREQL